MWSQGREREFDEAEPKGDEFGKGRRAFTIGGRVGVRLETAGFILGREAGGCVAVSLGRDDCDLGSTQVGAE